METTGKLQKIKQFVQNRVKQIEQQYAKTQNVMEKVRLATMKASFANILALFLGDQSQIAASIIKQAYAYLDAQCYQQAISRARIARGCVKSDELQKKQQMGLLIVKCMLKQKKYEDAHDILSGIQPTFDKIQYYKLHLQISLQLKQCENVTQNLEHLSVLVQDRFTKSSIQYGFYFILKGEAYGKFQKYQQAIKCLNQGMDILIDKKCKEKKKIADVYSSLAGFHRKLNNLQREYTSLVCAHSMIRQVQNAGRQTIQVIHLMIKTLLERQEYQKALTQLNKVKALEKTEYGQYSTNIGKTMKKMAQILYILNRKPQAKKYQQESSRILGGNNSNINQNSKNQTNTQTHHKNELHYKSGRNLKQVDLNKIK